ncbi:MAG: secondary thiamine-phosphate synthase enzyme YjbQ [Candidatus Hydrogenedentes bacterium]|nr:secondary thiamine-phosphate synthase enzyme YjbQ [Candidatus Hydrogenedentota bacterium]
MVYREVISLMTSGYGDMTDLTHQVENVIGRSGIKNGIVNIFNVGSTACIGTIEYEPGLVKDLPEQLSKIFPSGRHYAHEQTWHDGNGHSHLQATLVGSGITVPVENGRLVLGTWQQVFHLECDIKRRDREIVVTVIGE